MSEIINLAKGIISQEIEGLNALMASIDNSFSEAINAIESTTGKVILSGMGKSGYVAKKIAATLSSTGTPSVFLHPAEASHGDLGVISKSDIAILFSNSGETQELNSIISYCKRLNVQIIGVTRNQNSLLYEISDIKILIPNTPEVTDIGAPTTSSTMMIAWGDAIAVILLNKRSFSKDDYRLLHPGGSIGVRLIRIKDLMHTGDRIPLVKLSSTFLEMILEMTKKRLGCTGVVNEDRILVGVVTDGDLRRHIGLDFKKSVVSDFMTLHPLVIDQNMLAVQAFTLMNNKSITNLFIIDEEKKPIGVIHIHDFIKAGIS
ncbi:MAG: SIS domain-containing protein [Candidatus Midichloria sp.]|uniref:KpsF/GutQ family sugar-phosphate isomerase n=1 Tax=Hyalomma marginatum TaxID=34627 RepID=A0A8S4C0L9_9ACAR|nr:KpsF/GutQ family sugar-phosphate isomerase [Hyalomma marginatum]CAG7594236.1 KpsF/GutQ family sugar-phosphate isomerase [Hyalomma marginatum]